MKAMKRQESHYLEFLFLAILLIPFQLSAQEFADTSSGTPEKKIEKEKIYIIPGSISYTENLKSPFLFEEWTPGEIFLKGGKVESNGRIKYDLFLDQLVYMRPTGEYMTLMSYNIEKFVLAGARADDDYSFLNMNFKHFKLGSRVQPGFYEVILEDKTSLLAKRKKRLIAAGRTSTYTKPDSQFLFKRDDDYYVVKEDGSIYKVKFSSHFFLRLFSNRKSELKKFLKEEKIKIKKESDVVELISYYNTISAGDK
jgi:hypothetical protein